MNLITSLKLCLRLKCGTILPTKLTNMQRQGLHKDVSKNKYLLFYVLLFFHHVAWFNICFFSWFFKWLRLSHTKLLFNIFPELSMTGQTWWLAMWWLGHPYFHHVSLPFMGLNVCVMKAKTHFIDFRYWQFKLTCWSAYSNLHKKQLM